MAEAELANSGDNPQVNGGATLGEEDDRKLFVGGLPQDATQVIIDVMEMFIPARLQI